MKDEIKMAIEEATAIIKERGEMSTMAEEKLSELLDLPSPTSAWAHGPVGKPYPMMFPIPAGTTKIETDPMELVVRDAIKKRLEERMAIEKSTAEPKVEEVAAVADVAIDSDTAYALLGITRHADIPNFKIKKFEKESWNEQVQFLVPNEDKSYKLPVDATLSILRSWETNDKTLIYGPTGSGKSSLVKELCARTGRPFLRVNATGDMDSSMMFGQLTAKDGSTVWQDGSVTEAVRHGAVLAWDEWELTPPEIAMGMQWLLEDNARLFLKEMPGKVSDKYIVPNDNFRIVCLGNTQGSGDETGHHAGTNVQNSATVDRFGTVIKLDYMSPEEEVAMITAKVKGASVKTVRQLVKIANLIRQAYKTNQLNITFSPRTLIGVTNKMALGLSLNSALTIQYYNKLNDTNQRVARELVKKVVGE
jgi:cobaltochelatase CobS